MKLLSTSLSVQRDLKSSFHHCGGIVKLLHDIFSARKGLESSFHRY